MAIGRQNTDQHAAMLPQSDDLPGIRDDRASLDGDSARTADRSLWIRCGFPRIRATGKRRFCKRCDLSKLFACPA